jgi:transcriptional regulator with XRE-family HTH domain
MASSAAIAFGREVRRRRHAQGLTLETLGAEAGLTPQFIGGIEAGQRDPSIGSMAKIAAGLGAPLGELLGMPELSAEALEGARHLSAVPPEVRAPIVVALRAIDTITRKR